MEALTARRLQPTSHAEISQDQFIMRLRPRAQKLQEEEEQYADSKSGLKPKKLSKRQRVRAEPDVSSSDEETVASMQDINLQTAGVINHEQLFYQPEIVTSLQMEREARQRDEIVQGPLPENAFIQQQQDLSQPAIEPTTATKTGDVHRKREVVALARLRAAAERREIADQAKFDAAIAKLKEEEEKIKLSAEKKKQELLAKKQAAEEKKKAALEQKRIAAEERKKTSEEKKLKSLQEKLAMADKRKEGMERRRKEMEEAKQLKAQERKNCCREKKSLQY
ncbi:hypothetical protein ZWY2020_049102 [Hordeum vulgare]|nr:hypothetical protein ZWY2020_049102 [Hordeum vulgare]